MNTLKPSKTQLQNDYYNLNLTQQQIAEKYNYKTRQVISRLFNEYNIKTKTKSETSSLNFSTKTKIPTKLELEQLYKTNSISQIAKNTELHRDTISKLLDKYKITKVYFKNYIDNSILKKELDKFSVKELCVKYSITPSELKRRVGSLPVKEYSLEQIIKIINLYDINEKYFGRQICNDDLNVYNSILKLTKDHYLQSDKITERVYRLLNNINDLIEFTCSKCHDKLKFYTLKNGYGHTSHNICKNCIPTLSGCSVPSQELFWKLFEVLNKPNNCYFSELNNERTIYINNIDKTIFAAFQKLNKKRYHVDFILNNRIIEYDGDYWHNDPEKENIKDQFLNSKGFSIFHVLDSSYKKDPDKVLNECITFLTQ
jgi:very-short-patch-repair endonuclease/transcriptional regulator with XRE-family HTH domain